MGNYATVVIDFETTGLSPGYGDRTIEVGAVLISNHLASDGRINFWQVAFWIHQVCVLLLKLDVCRAYGVRKNAWFWPFSHAYPPWNNLKDICRIPAYRRHTDRVKYIWKRILKYLCNLHTNSDMSYDVYCSKCKSSSRCNIALLPAYFPRFNSPKNRLIPRYS